MPDLNGNRITWKWIAGIVISMLILGVFALILSLQAKDTRLEIQMEALQRLKADKADVLELRRETLDALRDIQRDVGELIRRKNK